MRVRVNSYFSFWKKIIAGVPQGSILGPLSFNISINDLFPFFSNSNLRNYTDHNILYSSGFTLEELKKSTAWVLILRQLRNGFMKITWFLNLGSVILCVLEKMQNKR